MLARQPVFGGPNPRGSDHERESPVLNQLIRHGAWNVPRSGMQLQQCGGHHVENSFGQAPGPGDPIGFRRVC